MNNVLLILFLYVFVVYCFNMHMYCVEFTMRILLLLLNQNITKTKKNNYFIIDALIANDASAIKKSINRHIYRTMNMKFSVFFLI